MKIFGKEIGSKNNAVGSTAELKKFFADDSYLMDKEKPEMLVVVPVNNVLRKTLSDYVLIEENAKILKNLVNDYQVKIVALTGYTSPFSDKDKAKEHKI